jgi:SSS family solute:Na+ symporter
LKPIDFLVLAVYAIAVFGLAQWVSRDRDKHQKTSTDYFLAGRSLPWWAIGASLIAANISAEQIIGMSGSGYAIGLAIASYEWMAALTLLIVAKWLLPIFLKNGVTTMPNFLEQRYGPVVRSVMAGFWLVLYIFVNVTSILWLGSIAVNAVAGIDQMTALIVIGVFALAYQLWGGLKAVALTDIVQVTLLIAGGLTIVALSLSQISGGHGVLAGFNTLVAKFPDKFHMILSRDNPHFKELPGLSVLFGGLWIMNVSYWGFNQYIIQRALAAKSLNEAQNGIAFAAYLKLLMPVIVVVPGLAALILAPNITKPDQAYPAMMQLLPSGVLGLVFAALVAAIVASLAAKINSIATIFTLDVYKPYRPNTSETDLVKIGRLTAIGATVIGIIAAKPLLGGADQAFQFIQEFTGFFTPGIVVIFLLGMFWKKTSAAGALTAAIGSVVLSTLFKFTLPALPFMDRVGLVFLISTAAAVIISLIRPAPASVSTISLEGVNFKTGPLFNIAGVGVLIALVVIYKTFW